MAHTPVNHPARPIYRALGGLTGLYLAIFGVLGFIANSGEEFFARDGVAVLGQGTNLAYSVLATVLGVAILVAIGVGRNADTKLTKFLGFAYLILSLAELAVLRTDVNILGFSVATVIVSMIIGLVLMMVGMYTKVGTEEEYRAWQQSRLQL